MTKHDLNLTYAEGQSEDRMCTNERSYPKVGVGQILKWYLEYFSSYIYFSKLFQNLNTAVIVIYSCI